MNTLKKLYGTELVDCARANAKQGIKIAAYQCGYGEDIASFAQKLHQACEQMNLQIQELSQLITDHDKILEFHGGDIFAPRTPSQL
ncbi:hypothetical protein RintRC_4261 [Richelia intracellularis]|nr:hypothetical protein RintRC_4261 [Richelia intracellularis]